MVDSLGLHRPKCILHRHRPGLLQGGGEGGNVASTRSDKANCSMTGLTLREEQIITVMMTECTRTDRIAESIKLSQSSVKNYLVNILHKIGGDNKADIVFWALRNGWELDMSHNYDGIARDDKAAKHAIERLLATIINIMEGNGVSPSVRADTQEQIEAIIETALATVESNGK